METLRMEERLWEYIDGVSNPAEKADVERLLQTQNAWRAKYEELLQVHQLISNSDLEEPSLRFSQNVMEDITRFQIAPATRSYINKKVIFGIGGFFLVMIAGMLIYTIAQIDWSSGGSSDALSFEVRDIQWNKYVNNTYTNIFMMVNIVLGLMLLDKYLSRKRDQHKQHRV